MARGPRVATLVTRAAFVVFLSLTGGCGFVLQGAAPLPREVSVVRIDTTEPRTAFADALQRRLRAAGVTLAISAAPDSPGATSAAVLRIERDEFLERVAALSARNVPREYEYTYVVQWSLESAGVRRVETSELTASRNLTFDERRVLAKQREREQLREALAEELVGVVLQRISGLR